MKKIFALLFAVTAFFTQQTAAQTCNPAFDIQFLTGSTIKCTPAITTDSPWVQHSWNFGDGSSPVHNIFPTHTYNTNGTFNITHIVERHTPNATFVCRDTLVKVVTIQQANCNLQPFFTWSASGPNPQQVNFNNQTVNLAITDSVRWTFGDGGTSLDVNPAHFYATAGTYQVCLIIKRNSNTVAPCIREYCTTITVNAACNLQANFTWQIAGGNPLEVHFTNTSVNGSNTDSTIWSFGDGTSSTAINPTHVYTSSGSYTVCLKVKRNNAIVICESYTCQTVTVATPCNLIADFTWYRDSSAITPYTYHFQNTSTPLNNTDSIRWSFGDGSFSNAVNPNHIYAQPGTYPVCLIIRKRNANGQLTNCVKEVCKTIIVQQNIPCNIQAHFSWKRDTVNYREISFTNLTSVPTANAIATWTFGDGSSAVSWNAIHEYMQAGTYYVCLKVQYSNTCIATTCDTITVTVPAPPCNQLSNYHFQAATNNNLSYQFIPDYINNDITYTWTFGDGTGSLNPITSHTFTSPGTYTVCLTAYRNNSCASTTCKTITVTQNACNNFTLSYNIFFEPGNPKKVYFYSNANTVLVDELWTIIKYPVTTGSTPVIFHQPTPVYTFPDTGYYRVCLKGTSANGCIKEYCSLIHVTGTSNVCQLQAYPNPAHDVVNVNVVLGASQTIYGYIYNSLNVLVMQKQQAGIAGNNVMNFSINNLVAGSYTIKIIHGNDVCFTQFTKL